MLLNHYYTVILFYYYLYIYLSEYMLQYYLITSFRNVPYRRTYFVRYYNLPANTERKSDASYKPDIFLRANKRQ